MQSGYVKIWRKAIDNGWLQNHKLWAFWCWCLMKATHKEYDQIVGCQQVHLVPGSFVFGRKAAAKETNISEQSIRTLLDFLKTSGNLTINPTNKYSIISITNWDTYQNEDIKINQQINQQLTNNQPTTNHKQTQKNKRINTYTSEFLSFYSEYPKHIGKEPAWKAWQNVKNEIPPLDDLLKKIQSMKQTEDWLKENGRFIPHPATWLNQKRWLDETEVKSGSDKYFKSINS